jgi:hypothetical protein
LAAASQQRGPISSKAAPIKAESSIKSEIKDKPPPPVTPATVRRYKSGALISALTSAVKRSGATVVELLSLATLTLERVLARVKARMRASARAPATPGAVRTYRISGRCSTRLRSLQNIVVR